MKTERRNFLKFGAAIAAGAAAACSRQTSEQDQAKTAPSAKGAPSPVSLMMQFSGLLIHGRWPAKDASKPYAYSGWDALLVHDASHEPRLKIPLANVANLKNLAPKTFELDRYLPHIGVWKLDDVDLIVKLDGVAQGPVTGVTGKRAQVGGKRSDCPVGDDEYLDITWMADFDEILGKGNGTLKDELKNAPKDFPPNLVRARVRLPEGTMECARPSLPYFEKVKFDYSDVHYTPQFTADLTRVTSRPAGTITLDLVSFKGGTVTLELVAVGTGPIGVYVENHNPKLIIEALKGHIKPDEFWEHHFLPYYHLLKKAPGGKVVPAMNCCDAAGPGCDPPFYCVPPGGHFA